ncbi:MAG: hypothetical protein GXP31_17295 [Kiritimatiellaeota bacterium]|nr:hypothetical protein [Kiritimatiellota bacterium]
MNAKKNYSPGKLRAGVARGDITNLEAGPPNDPLYVKALVLRNDETAAALITVDAVAVAEIGSIPNSYLAEVRSRIRHETGISPANVVVSASHCHGSVCADITDRTVKAVLEAWRHMVPVKVGAGKGYEDRIMENRRLRLRDGSEADSRHAYPLPPDAAVAGAGPVDPEIGVLRLDREDGRPLAVVYNFACHPIRGVPNGRNTADIIGFASKVIENSSGAGTLALFLQGCGGDVNPIRYKDVDAPRDAEPLGNMLGLSTLWALNRIQTSRNATLEVVAETLELPRADLAPHIAAMEARRIHLIDALHGTSLNLKTFLHLFLKYNLFKEFPSYYSHLYLHEQALGRNALGRLDADNHEQMKRYIENIYVMEELTRLRENLRLLKMHHAQNAAAGKKTVDVELTGLRVGDFVLLAFPGELSVQIGLNIKKRSPHKRTFIAGVTNGYIYYAPTAEQLKNRGGAQEDSDCILAPAWQALFEKKAVELLHKL